MNSIVGCVEKSNHVQLLLRVMTAVQRGLHNNHLKDVENEIEQITIVCDCSGAVLLLDSMDRYIDRMLLGRIFS